MQKYLNLLHEVLNIGIKTEGRNGITRSIFGRQVQYDLTEHFPILTSKKIAFNVIVGELLGFIHGYTHINDFNKLDCKIWDANAQAWNKGGSLGRIYGAQWRNWKSINPETTEPIEVDQLQTTIDNIKKDPFSRRHIITAWNPGELSFMALPPCHLLLQFYVSCDNDTNVPKYLSLMVYQRSADIFLGVPFNITSYSLLLSMISQLTNLKPLHFIHSLGNIHLYEDHVSIAKKQLRRKVKAYPTLELNPDVACITQFTPNDIKLCNYKSHSHLKAKMIV